MFGRIRKLLKMEEEIQEFLRSKGMLKDGFKAFKIHSLAFGTVDLNELIREFVKSQPEHREEKEQIQKALDEMDECANKYIIQDALNSMNQNPTRSTNKGNRIS